MKFVNVLYHQTSTHTGLITQARMNKKTRSLDYNDKRSSDYITNNQNVHFYF